jgi:hypothetical protein
MLIRGIILFFCLAAALMGCTRREETSGAPREDAARGQPAASPSSTQNRQTPRRQEAPAANRQPEVRAYTNRDDPLFGLPPSVNLPLDFTLGPLYNEAATDAPSREVYTLIVDFLAALNRGKDAKEYLHPDYRSFLARSLQNEMRPGGEWRPPETGEDDAEEEGPAENTGGETALPGAKPPESGEHEKKPEAPLNRLKSALKSFRVGEIRFSEDKTLAQTEVLITNTAPGGVKCRARGSLIAEKKDERWYLAGFTIDFDSLFAAPAGKTGEVFDPGPSTEPLF